jgi:hypothetical protein
VAHDAAGGVGDAEEMPMKVDSVIALIFSIFAVVYAGLAWAEVKLNPLSDLDKARVSVQVSGTEAVKNVSTSSLSRELRTIADIIVLAQTQDKYPSEVNRPDFRLAVLILDSRPFGYIGSIMVTSPPQALDKLWLLELVLDPHGLIRVKPDRLLDWKPMAPFATVYPDGFKNIVNYLKSRDPSLSDVNAAWKAEQDLQLALSVFTGLSGALGHELSVVRYHAVLSSPDLHQLCQKIVSDVNRDVIEDWRQLRDKTRPRP